MSALPDPATAKNSHPGRFQPGQSGNPKGRPKGRADRRTRLFRAIEGDIPALLRTVVDRAVDGDMVAAGLILNRVYPTLKPRGEPVRFDLDPGASLAGQAAQIVAAMASGQVAPDTCRTLLDSLDTLAAIRATEQLTERVEALEESIHG